MLSFQNNVDVQAPEGYNSEADVKIVEEDHHAPKRHAARAARDAEEAGPNRQAARAANKDAPDRQDVPKGRLVPARHALGGFLNAEKTAICLSEHASAMIGVMHLASAHPNGICGSFGDRNRTRWVRA